MNLKPGEDIGLEVHKKIDQLLIFVRVMARPNIGGQKFPIKEGTLAFVPAGILIISSIQERLSKVVYNLFAT